MVRFSWPYAEYIFLLSHNALLQVFPWHYLDHIPDAAVIAYISFLNIATNKTSDLHRDMYVHTYIDTYICIIPIMHRASKANLFCSLKWCKNGLRNQLILLMFYFLCIYSPCTSKHTSSSQGLSLMMLPLVYSLGRQSSCKAFSLDYCHWALTTVIHHPPRIAF